MTFIVIGLAVGVGTVVALRSLTATMEQEIGAQLDQEVRMKQWWQVAGRVPDKADELLLGYEPAQKLGVIEGAKPAGHDSMLHSGHASVRQPELKLLSAELTLGGEQFRVAGVIQETGAQDDQMIFTSLPTAQRVLSRFSTALSVVMLLIGFVMVFITMMNSVVERTREVGVLRALNEQGQTILMVTHNPEAAAATHRVIEIQDGVLLSESAESGCRATQSLMEEICAD